MDVKAKIMPHDFPVQTDVPGWAERVANAESAEPPQQSAG